jgi:hypothetical protein
VIKGTVGKPILAVRPLNYAQHHSNHFRHGDSAGGMPLAFDGSNQNARTGSGDAGCINIVCASPGCAKTDCQNIACINTNCGDASCGDASSTNADCANADCGNANRGGPG